MTYYPDGLPPNMSTAPIIEHSNPRPFSAAETLTPRPSDSGLQGSTRASSEVDDPKAKRANDELADQDRDLEKQETKDKSNGEDSKDEKDEEEQKDPNLIEWDGPDDKVGRNACLSESSTNSKSGKPHELA